MSKNYKLRLEEELEKSRIAKDMLNAILSDPEKSDKYINKIRKYISINTNNSDVSYDNYSIQNNNYKKYNDMSGVKIIGHNNYSNNQSRMYNNNETVSQSVVIL